MGLLSNASSKINGRVLTVTSVISGLIASKTKI